MLAGRLADPNCTLGTDPRSDPRMVAALTGIGLAGELPEARSRSTRRSRTCSPTARPPRRWWASVFDHLALAAEAPTGVSASTVTIPGADGNELTLFVSRPTAAPDGPLPAVVHFHGGGMAIASAADAATGCCASTWPLPAWWWSAWSSATRAAGRVHPYPAGLNDCAAATRWVHANAADLGISHLIVCGESGGGNLTLTVTHKAKREGWLDEIAGAYAQCPYISNRWLDYPEELPSLRENDGYFISCQQAALPRCPVRPRQEAFARADLLGVERHRAGPGRDAPHVISVNELDPLRDEGLLYYRRLLAAGVSAVGRIVAGTCHGGDMMFPHAMPDVLAATVRDISGFARSLTP
ncbi:MAG: alpha/beta hydrolase fold domain-containing protein [Mycobacterium sp.]